MTPMRERRNNQAIEVGENRLHWLALLRRSGWKLGLEIAGLDLRQHRQLFDMFEVICDPVDYFMTEAPELISGHVAELRCSLFQFGGRLVHH